MSDVDDDGEGRVRETRPVDDIDVPFDAFHSENDPALLNAGEVYWRDRQEWLGESGYLLRPRYSRNWKPVWERAGRHPRAFEDGWPMPINRALFTMDAIHIADRNFTLLKRIQVSKLNIPPDEIPEVAITRYFSSEELSKDPKNHCVPLYDVLSEPDTGDMILVTPFLRPFNNPKFLTVGEVVDFIGQVLEGLEFMHQHSVAHRNCTAESIMMDGSMLYPGGFHPVLQDRAPNITRKAKHYSRTEHPTRYYLCDFALSQQFDRSAGPPSAMPIHASDRSVPEFQGNGIEEPYDPFPTDVYLIGNMIKSEFALSKYGFEFLFPLVEAMTEDDPALRPTMDDVVWQFNELRGTLRKSKLRSRVIPNDELEISGMLNGITHFFRTIKFALKGIPPAASRDARNSQRQQPELAPWPDNDSDSSYDSEKDGPNRRIPDYRQTALDPPNGGHSRRGSVKGHERDIEQERNGHYRRETGSSTSHAQVLESPSSLGHQENRMDAERQSLSRQGHNTRPSRSNSLADQARPRANSRSGQPPSDTRPVRRESSNRGREGLPDEYRPGHANGSVRNNTHPPPAQPASVRAPSRRDATPPPAQPPSVKASNRRERTPPPAQVPSSKRASSRRDPMPPPAPPPKPEKVAIGKWDCAMCNKRIPGKAESIEHMLRKHPSYKICNDCGSYYTSHASLEKHQEKRGHGEYNRGRTSRKHTGDS